MDGIPAKKKMWSKIKWAAGTRSAETFATWWIQCSRLKHVDLKFQPHTHTLQITSTDEKSGRVGTEVQRVAAKTGSHSNYSPIWAKSFLLEHKESILARWNRHHNEPDRLPSSAKWASLSLYICSRPTWETLRSKYFRSLQGFSE